MAKTCEEQLRLFNARKDAEAVQALKNLNAGYVY